MADGDERCIEEMSKSHILFENQNGFSINFEVLQPYLQQKKKLQKRFSKITGLQLFSVS